MNPTEDLTQLGDAELSRTVAQRAGVLLMALRKEFFRTHPVDSMDKAVSDQLRDQADRAAHLFIMDKLSAARPLDAILSEEGKDDAARLELDRVWIVDPLDGTWEYGQGRKDFGVHIALWNAKAGKLSAGTVDLPDQGITRSVLDTVETVTSKDSVIRVVASRSRPPATLKEIVTRLGDLLTEAEIAHSQVEIVDVGSVGAKVNEILCGRADVYLHNTGFYEWDVAAPYIVAEHYGLIASHMDGAPITFNHMPPYVTDLVVSRADLYPHVLRAIKETQGA
jgi:3'(2'), 5'-bisphosphate nucleotidase